LVADKVQDADKTRPGIVHRLDRDTSGLVVIAKHPAAKTYLQKLFKTRRVKKTYQALLVGRIKPDAAVIKLPIDRKPGQPTKRAVVKGGREAVTVYRLLKAFPGYSLVEVQPETGRTHQLRVHFSHLGHPMVGDSIYGRSEPKLGRHWLHAAKLEFKSPSGRKLKLSSPLPAELKTWVDQL
jgi:23S rRNA pseudouridine1911/1915/1917 synthase